MSLGKFDLKSLKDTKYKILQYFWYLYNHILRRGTYRMRSFVYTICIYNLNLSGLPATYQSANKVIYLVYEAELI